MLRDILRNKQLERQVRETYFFLRLGTGILALLFPLLLGIVGKLAENTPLQESLSAYYYTGMRDVFVGVLCAIGFFLLLYKGFTKHENWALNIAGVLAMGIAIIPMNCPGHLGTSLDCVAFSQVCRPFTASILHNTGSLHNDCAALFFLTIGYVSVFLSGETLYLIKDDRREYYKHAYRVLGWAMLLIPPAAWAWFNFVQPGNANGMNYSVLAVEFAGIWIFAAYWLAKTFEIYHNEADQKFLPKELRS